MGYLVIGLEKDVDPFNVLLGANGSVGIDVVLATAQLKGVDALEGLDRLGLG